MRFSVQSHSKLYFLLIFAFTFYFLSDFTPFSSFGQLGIDLTIAYGQLNVDDKNDHIDWKQISMRTLEGGQEAFGERGKIYGNR